MKVARVYAGHPVDVATGGQITAAHDIEVMGIAPLIWRRAYSSELLNQSSSPLGRGWRHKYLVKLSPNPQGLQFSDYDGNEVQFELSTVGQVYGLISQSLGNAMELRRSDQTYEVWHWHDVQSAVQKFVFSNTASEQNIPLERIETPAGAALQMLYAGGRLTEVRQVPEGRCLRLQYNYDGLLDCVSLGHVNPKVGSVVVARYQFDGEFLVRVTDALGGVTRYEYDNNGRLIAEIGPDGNRYTMSYDPEGRCIESTGEDGYQRRTFEYLDSLTTVVTDSLGYQTVYKFNDLGQVVQTINPGGGTQLNEYDHFGRVVSQTDVVGGTTRYSYDDAGNLAITTYPSGATREVKFNDSHLPVHITDTDGAVWELTYERGGLVAVTDPLGNITRYQRDAANVVCGVTTPAGNQVAYRRDADWFEETIEDSLGLVLHKRFDLRLNEVRILDANGLVIALTYDAVGRVVETTDGEGGREQMTYTPGGWLTTYRDPDGGLSRYEYTPYGDCTATTDAAGRTYRFELNSEADLVRILNPHNEQAALDYDADGNVVGIRYFDGSVERNKFDTAGRLVRQQRPSGALLEFEYDVSGNVARVRSDGDELLSYEYDTAGQIVRARSMDAEVTLRYDLCGRVVGEVQDGVEIAYEYGPHGNVVTRTCSQAGIEPLRLKYDQRRRLISISAGSILYQEFVYDQRDLVVERRMQDAVERLQFDAHGWLRTQAVHCPGGMLTDRQFRYSANGLLLQVTATQRGTCRYAYDRAEQILWWGTGERTADRNVYDACGNLIRSDEQVLNYGAGNRVYHVGDKLWRLDADGRLIDREGPGGREELSWNALDWLTAITCPDGKTTEYGYDGFGRRITKRQGDIETRFVWAGDNLLQERTSGRTVDYAIDGFWPHAWWINGAVRHAIVGPDGRVSELYDSSGRRVWMGTYDPHGRLTEEQGEPGSNPLRLPGQYFDAETGFHYNRFRYYDSVSGRYLSPDPLGFLGSLNLFVYAPNALNWSDPLGLKCRVRTNGWSVYVLEKNGKIVYVGITDQFPHARLSGHRNDILKKPVGSFDQMRVVATGLPNRRAARNIEGSALHHIDAGNIAGVDTQRFLNAPRRSGGYWHGYRDNVPSAPPRTNPTGRVSNRYLLSETDVQNRLSQTVVALPR